MKFQNLKLAYKMGVLVVTAFVFMLGVSAYFVTGYKTTLMEDRKEKTQNLVEVAHTLMMKFHDLEKEGVLTREEAQKQAIAAVESLRYDSKNYFFMFNTDLVMVGHPLKKNLVGTSVADYQDATGKKHFVDMAEKAKQGGGFVDYYWSNPKTGANVPKLSYASLVPDWNIVVASGIYIEDVEKIYNHLLYKSIGIISAALLFLGGIAWSVSRTIVVPLSDITRGVKELAEDHIIEVGYKDRQDEVGDMARGLSFLNERMEEARRMEAEQEVMKREAERERRAGMLKLADDFEQKVGCAIDAVIRASGDLEGTSQSMSSLAEETSSQAMTVSAAADEASANVQSVASATEELTASIREITSQMQQTEKSTHTAAESVQETKHTMDKLTSAVGKVGSVAEVIANIAEQTNLLALNATIEAARAGEAGKGFAVVANEVKTLASETAKATQEITEIIKDVQTQTTETADAVERIAEVIEIVSNATSSVSVAVEEQNSATGEISRSVQEASTGTGEVTRNITDVSTAAAGSGKAATDLLHVARDMSEKSALMQAQIKEFLANVRQA